MKTGIWLDNQKAYIVYLTNEKEELVKINSEVEDYHISGGAAAPSPYGTHDTVSERRLLERKKQQLSRYFKKVMDRIKDCEQIYICGPAGAKIGLRKEVLESESLKHRLVSVETCDSMTENQIIAQVKTFFKGDSSFHDN